MDENENSATPDATHMSQCQAKTAKGRQCRIRVIGEHEFCLFHSNSQRVLETAQKTLNGLSVVAVDIVDRALNETEEVCVLCGHGIVTTKKLKAAAMVMDRVGLGPTLKIEHSVTVQHELIVSMMTDDEFRIVDEIMQRVMARAEQDAKLTEGGGQ